MVTRMLTFEISLARSEITVHGISRRSAVSPSVSNGPLPKPSRKRNRMSISSPTCGGRRRFDEELRRSEDAAREGRRPRKHLLLGYIQG